MRLRLVVLGLLLLLAGRQGGSQQPGAFPPDVRVERGVAYLGAGRSELADVYHPSRLPRGGKAPAVVMIHGGGFTGGRRDAAREINVCTNLARSGYLAVSIDYALSRNGEAVWPRNLHDCKTAIRWARATAGRLAVDPGRIGVIGGSAGGHLAAMVALTGPRDGLDPDGPYPEQSCRVQCAVDLYAPSDLTGRGRHVMLGRSAEEAPELYRQASPVTHASAGDPPMLLLHGTADATVPVRQSELLAAALKQAGVPHELVIVPGAPHSFHLEPRQKDLRPIVIGFFDRHLKAP